MARVVLGFPMYRSEEFVADVIQSLLSLNYENLAVVAIDDCSPDATLEIARSYASSNPRLVVEGNASRLGMIGNWNRVLDRTYELFPDFEYFAWASDNDFREPSWVSTLTQALEDNPGAALAYCRFGTIEQDGARNAGPSRWFFETRDIDDPLKRLRATTKGMRAGLIMYGLHRRETLERAGNVPEVLLSDVLFLSHLSLYGTFVQVPEVLWYRGLRRTGGSSGRQRAALFADPPLSTFLPFSLQHTLWLLRTMVFGERRPPGMTRAGALGVATIYLANWYGRLVSRVAKKNRKWRRKKRKTMRRQRLRLRERLVRVLRFRR